MARTPSLAHRLGRRLPQAWQPALRRLWQGLRARLQALRGAAHVRRIEEEVARFEAEAVVHDLPPIFHYWSNTHLRPRLEEFGFSCPEAFFAQRIARQQRALGRPLRVVSLGAGNADTELAVAQRLRELGVEDFSLCCVDIAPAMLERGRSHVDAAGLGSHFRFERGDLNVWTADVAYDVAMANQSLHHVANLPALFDAVAAGLDAGGVFVIADTIGRNGHRRWPEALTLVREFWRELPARYRYNLQLQRHERRFLDWDCSAEGFEGIRAQDILPLAMARFGFEFFYAYGNLVDPFVDRSFGPHFDAKADWDRNFIDRVHARDEAEILAGRLSPTHMFAVLSKDRGAVPQVHRHLTPEFCLRRTA